MGRRTTRGLGHLSRRQLVQRSAAIGAGAMAAPLFRRGYAANAAMQEDIPRTPSTVTLDGPLRVLLKDDFHPDHNAFMRSELEAFAEASGWDIEITDVAGYQGGGDLNQKLLGGVQAGDAPDLLIHDIGARNLHTLGLVQPVDEWVAEMTEQYGEPIYGARLDAFIEDQWRGLPFFSRANGHYIRSDYFAEVGLDPNADTETYDKMRNAAMTVTDAAQNRWGWGMTINRSGDGNAMVQNVIFRHGGHVQDESGQKVTFNSPETIAGLNWLKETYSAEEFQPMLPPGILSWTDTNNNEAFLAGQIAITQNAGTVYAKAVFDDVPFHEQIAYVPYPVRNTDNARLDAMTGGMKFYLITDAKNPDAVADVARHFLSQPVQERIWSISTGYALPAYTNRWDSPVLTENPISMAGMEIALNETDFTGLQWPGPLNEAIGSIAEGTYFTDAMAEVLQGTDVEEVVANYHEQFVQIFQDFGLDGE